MFLVRWEIDGRGAEAKRKKRGFYYRFEALRNEFDCRDKPKGSLLFTEDRGFATRVYDLASKFGHADLFVVERVVESKPVKRILNQELPDRSVSKNFTRSEKVERVLEEGEKLMEDFDTASAEIVKLAQKCYPKRR